MGNFIRETSPYLQFGYLLEKFILKGGANAFSRPLIISFQDDILDPNNLL